MIKSISQLFESASNEAIVSAIRVALKNSGESPFWSEKAPLYTETILSVLIPLRDQHLLFTPEGKPAETLTPELFLRWCDLLSLKMLAFTLQASNASGRLERTAYDDTSCERYSAVDMERLATYLNSYMINLENELLDFPNTHYNLHQGITNVLAGIIRQ